MILGIDATNLRTGGGVTHLVELLGAAYPQKHGIDRVIVWGGNETLEKIPNRSWLRKVSPSILNRGVLIRTFWQRFKLSSEAIACNCDVILVPGGNFSGTFRPFVTMSRNLLPFEWKELRRYGCSLMMLKLILLRYAQSKSCKNADGVIFLTEYAKRSVQDVVGKINVSSIIPHGLNVRFQKKPKTQYPITEYSESNPYQLLYVSPLEPYKHQWNVIEAVFNLRLKGYPLSLDFVGSENKLVSKKFNDAIKKFDPNGQWVRYSGAVPYEQLDQIYSKADLGVFASSCENMPNTLLEKMSAGLPIVCSLLGPMPEVLGDTGLYFDPECPKDIATKIQMSILSPTLRSRMADSSFERSMDYSWERCAAQTFDFITKVVLKNNR